MKRLLTVCCAALVVASAGPAWADCADFSKARAAAAQAEARRNPLTTAELAMPHFNGLERNFDFVGDPKCERTGPSGHRDRGRYKLTVSFREYVATLYPNIQRRTTVDGMNRRWFANPLGGDVILLTSGTELNFIGRRTGPDGDPTFSEVMIKAPASPQPLTQESQPYSAADIASATPWPGGPNGGRQFVRADGNEGASRPTAAVPAPAPAPAAVGGTSAEANAGPATTASAQSAAQAAAQTATDAAKTSTKAPANCPPPVKAEGDTPSARARGAEVADAVAGKVGGAVGNAAGALGSLLGKKPAAPAPAAPAKPAGCP